MVDKWLDMLGLYDFLGVICPGIFAAGMASFLWHVNISGFDDFGNLVEKYSFLKHLVYAFIIVAVYVLGSFIHELGHYCAHMYNVGFGEGFRMLRHSVDKNRKVLDNGNCEAEQLFLVHNLSNSSIIERKIWFNLMKRGDFCKNNAEYHVTGILEDNIEQEKFKEVSAAFYQHCKRVISLKGYSASSKKKESIYGFCRNMGVIFLIMILLVMVWGVWCLFTVGFKTFCKAILEIICLAPFFVVFSAKSIRYKNMEVVDTIRTYRYLAENHKLRMYTKKQKRKNTPKT